MPVICSTTYAPPAFLRNGHLLTIFPAVFRKVPGVRYRRERIATPDDDFLDLDWAETGSKKLAVVCHGLEGDSRRPYMLGMARALNRRNWDVLAWNYRSCGGEINRRLRFYHSGETDDLQAVIRHAAGSHRYEEMALVGFSAGGNMVLKFAGEQGREIPDLIRKVAAFSVPCDLTSGDHWLARPSNRLYLKRFLRTLHEKVSAKMQAMPDAISDCHFRNVKTFREFDNAYTAPHFGFRNAEDYWEKSSCKPFLAKIRIPALIVNALDDPFLPAECYPIAESADNPLISLVIPKSGGHVGFVSFDGSGEYWSEKLAGSFVAGMGGGLSV